MLTSTAAVLPSRDFGRTETFYRALGVGLQGRWNHSSLIFDKDAVEVHFAHDPDHRPERANVAICIRTDDVDGRSADLERLSIWRDSYPRLAAAEDREWGMREMQVLDPDGHLFRVGQFING